MGTRKRKYSDHEPTTSVWPWLPDPTNIPAPLLQRPLDTVSDWISSEKLCEICSKLTLEENTNNEYEHRTAQDLERVAGAAVRTGEGCCPLCALIWKRMRDHFVYYYPNRRSRVGIYGDSGENQTNTFERWADWEAWHKQGKQVDEKAREVEFSRLMGQNGERVKLHEEYKFITIIHEASLNWPRVEFSDTTEDRLPNFQTRTLRMYTLPDAPSTGKVNDHIPWRNLTQAAQYTATWTRHCLHNHTMCPKSIESPLPKRLVDVGVYGESDRPRIWINPSMNSATNADARPTAITGTYLALSYCWGPEPFEVIGPQNLAKMTEEIPLKSLPLTIQDAMEFTRLLGIRYLWVDSLCILQGESAEAKVDWDKESVKMQTIYRNALLTIGAATGKSAYDGIRPAADRPEMPFCPLPKGFGGTTWPGQVYVGLKPLAGHTAALHKRAWTFQELLLSARYVNLGGTEISWYCKQISQVPGESWGTGSYPPIHGAIGNIFYSKYSGVGEVKVEWHRIVDNYTSRSISVAEDRLVALSGVAKDLWLRRDQQDEYLAGLWRNTITHDLLWKPTQHDCAPLSPTLPSWSWASQNKHVWYNDDHKDCCLDCAQFLGSRIVGDRFGHSVTGSIRLNGRIRKAYILEDKEDDNHELYENEKARKSFGWVKLDRPLSPEKKPIRTWSSDEHSEDDESPESGGRSEVLCLEMHSLYSGLLLSPESPGSNRYMRIGMFHQWGEPRYSFWGMYSQRGVTWDVFTGERCDLELV